MTDKPALRPEGGFSVFHSRTVHALILVCTVFIIYSNTFDSPFLFDDSDNIVDNPAIKDLAYFLDTSRVDGLSLDFNKNMFKTRTIGYLTFALNYAVGGLNVWGYHLVNILIHACNALLLYGLVSLLCKSPHVSGDRDTMPIARENLLFIAFGFLSI